MRHRSSFSTRPAASMLAISLLITTAGAMAEGCGAGTPAANAPSTSARPDVAHDARDAWQSIPRVASSEVVTALADHPDMPALITLPKRLQVWLPQSFGALEQVAREWMRARGISLVRVRDKEAANVIVDLVDGAKDESYTLIPGAEMTRITARDYAGIVHAFATLADLGEGSTCPALRIADKPAHAYRGLLIDSARRFYPTSELLLIIDEAARLKLNALQWHLADDQAIRIPLPAEFGPGRAGEFYTEDEIHTVVEHARARGIDVIPEFDMPGHTRALLARKPELSCRGTVPPEVAPDHVGEDVLCMGNPEARRLAGSIIDTLVRLFPGTYIHLGGDEAPTTRWHTCAKCQAAKAKKGLTSDAALAADFLDELAAHARKLGRTPIVWNDSGFAAMKSNPVVMEWTPFAPNATSGDVILAPLFASYFNLTPGEGAALGTGKLGTLPWQSVLHGVAEQLRGRSQVSELHVLGASAALWSETIHNAREVWELLYPRLQAFAEATWTGNAAGEGSFGARFQRLRKRLPGFFLDAPGGPRVRQVLLTPETVTWTAPEGFPDSKVEVAIALGSGVAAKWGPLDRPLTVDDTTTVSVRSTLPDGKKSPEYSVRFQKSTPLIPRPGRATRIRSVDAPFESVDEMPGSKSFGDWQTVAKIDDLTTLGLAAPKTDFGLEGETSIHVACTGIYRFYVESDDGAKLWVDDELVVAHDGIHAASTREGEVALEAGSHNIRMRYFQRGSGSVLRFGFHFGHGDRTKPALAVPLADTPSCTAAGSARLAR